MTPPMKLILRGERCGDRRDDNDNGASETQVSRRYSPPPCHPSPASSFSAGWHGRLLFGLLQITRNSKTNARWMKRCCWKTWKWRSSCAPPGRERVWKTIKLKSMAIFQNQWRGSSPSLLAECWRRDQNTTEQEGEHGQGQCIALTREASDVRNRFWCFDCSMVAHCTTRRCIRCRVVSSKNLFGEDLLWIFRGVLTFDCCPFELISNLKWGTI